MARAITIIVTGTPGTGKTTIAQRLAKRYRWVYIDVNDVISRKKLSSGYDRKKKCRIVDVRRLSSELVRLAEKHKKSGDTIVIDSHLSHYMPPAKADACVVTRCRLDLLKRRLKRRHYSADKIQENLDSEIFEVCLTEARETGHKIIIVETDKKIYEQNLILDKIAKFCWK